MPRKPKKSSPKRREGKFVYYDIKGTPCCRRLPDFVRQTAATQNAAGRFGAASRASRIIRHAFLSYLRHNRYDGKWVNRLNSALLNEGIEGLRQYSFNNKTHITQFLQFSAIGEDRKLHIRHFFKPKDRDGEITHMEIRFIAMRLDLNTGAVIDSKTEAHVQDVKQPFEGFSFDTELPGRGTLLVALQVSPYQHGYPLMNKYYNATALIVAEPAPAETFSKKHRKQQKRQELLQQVLQLPSAVHSMEVATAQKEKTVPIDVVTDYHSNDLPLNRVQRE